MLDRIKNLGTALSRDEQKTILGGKLNCLINGVCIQCTSGCAEPVCRLGTDPTCP